MKILRKALLVLPLLWTLVSCDRGPKPDKLITANLQIDVSSQAEMEQAFDMLKEKFGKFGMKPELTQIGDTYQCNFSLETAAQPDKIKGLLLSQGVLEFYKTDSADNVLYTVSLIDELVAAEDSLTEHPFISVLSMESSYSNSIPFYVKLSDTAYVNSVVNRQDVKRLLSKDAKNSMKFLWGKPETGNPNISLYAVLCGRNGKAAMQGSIIKSAQQTYNAIGRPSVNLRMNEKASVEWEELTDWAYKTGQQIAIVVDGVVYSAPGVLSGPIHGGRSEISANFTVEEAQELAVALETGMIPKIELLTFTFQPLQ